MVAGSLTPRLFPHFLMMSRVSSKHSLFPPVAVQHLPGLLGFEDKTSTPVEVDITAGDATVGFGHIDAAFKDVTVGGSIFTSRVRLGQAKQRGIVSDKGAPVFRRVNPVALTGGESFPG